MTLYTTIFTVALFTVANIWEQPKCLSTDERIKMWYIYIILVRKENEILPF